MKRIWAAGIIVALVVIGFLIFSIQSRTDKENISDSDSGSGSQEVNSEDNINQNTFTIEISSNGFSPNNLEINKEDSVVFVNMDSENHWPATDIHPSHQVYPGSSIAKCGTAEQTRIFDACKGLIEGERYSFTFNEVGVWRYHDHLAPGMRGTIIVK